MRDAARLRDAQVPDEDLSVQRVRLGVPDLLRLELGPCVVESVRYCTRRCYHVLVRGTRSSRCVRCVRVTRLGRRSRARAGIHVVRTLCVKRVV